MGTRPDASWLAALLLALFACGRSADVGGGGVGGGPAAETPPVTAGSATEEAAGAQSGVGGSGAAKMARSCQDGLCTIPAGHFIMGSPRGAISAAAFDNREVEVQLTHAFVIGETEVTRAQWFALGLPELVIDWGVANPDDDSSPPPGQTLCLDPECPAAWLSFEDAVSYANLRSEAEGLKPCYLLSGCVRSPGNNLRCASVRVDASTPYECEGYRLPTEAEWEYAARAGTRTDLYSGDLDPTIDSDAFDCKLDKNLDRIGWYCGNSGDSPHMAGTGHPHHVAQKEPNAFGLYDVSGNLFEWTNDRYHPAGYGAGPLVDPVNGVEDPSDLTPNTPVFNGMTDGKAADGFPEFRIRRGGAFDLWSGLASSGMRIYLHLGAPDGGMRIVRTLDPGPSGGSDDGR